MRKTVVGVKQNASFIRLISTFLLKLKYVRLVFVYHIQAFFSNIGTPQALSQLFNLYFLDPLQHVLI